MDLKTVKWALFEAGNEGLTTLETATVAFMTVSAAEALLARLVRDGSAVRSETKRQTEGLEWYSTAEGNHVFIRKFKYE